MKNLLLQETERNVILSSFVQLFDGVNFLDSFGIIYSSFLFEIVWNSRFIFAQQCQTQCDW